jgi:inner membrane protein
LFILLTFTTFFLFEVLNPIRIHPLQYLMVGSALCLFYVLLLSISEHLGFQNAYLIASVSTIGLITAYATKTLQSFARAHYGSAYVLLCKIMLRLESLLACILRAILIGIR